MPDQYPAPQPEPTTPPLQESATEAPKERAAWRSILFGADGLRAGWSLLLFAFLVFILAFTGTQVARHFGAHSPAHPQATSGAHPPPEQTLPSVLTQDGLAVLLLLVASLLMSRIERRPLASYGLGATPRALRQFLVGSLLGLVFLSILVALLKFTHLLTFSGRLLPITGAFRFGAEWAIGFLLVALAEEYLLRGFLLFTLARGLSGLFALIFKTPHRDALGFWTAATLLAFVFGLGHTSNPGESPIGLLSAALAALVFSFSLWRTGSLWWAVGFHAAWDWAQSFLYGVADSGLMMQHHLFATHPVGRPILSGGLTGPEGSLFVLPVLALIVITIWRTLPQVPQPAPFAGRTPAARATPEFS